MCRSSGAQGTDRLSQALRPSGAATAWADMLQPSGPGGGGKALRVPNAPLDCEFEV